LGLPDLFKGNNGWVEVESVPDRAHDRADDYRDCTRVFFKEGANGREAVALITQAFVVVRSGQIAPTPITIRVQLRQLYPSDSSVSQSVRQYEISRRALLSGSEPGGFLEYREDSPEYLPSAGNDYGFASRALDHELGHRDLPLLGTLRERCSACHRSDFSRVITLDMVGAGQTSSVLRYLDTAKDLHAVYVLKQKLQRDDWMSLIGSWL
jgi:hypothetical protein